MTKKEKTLVTLISIYFIGIIILMSLTLILSFFNIDIIGLLVLITLIYIFIGYIVIAVVRKNTFVYICSSCKKENKMTFIETLFSRRGDNSRLLKCKHCQKTVEMERMPK